MPKTFHVFIANCAEQFGSETSKEQWRFISTGSNPADDESRDLTTKQMLNNLI